MRVTGGIPPGYQRLAEDRVGGWLMQHHVGPRRSSADPVLEIQWTETAVGFQFDVVRVDADRSTVMCSAACEGCTELELVDKIVPALDHSWQAAGGLPVVIAKEAPLAVESPVSDTSDKSEHRAAVRRWGPGDWVGLGTMVVGGAGVVASIPLIIAGERTVSAPGTRDQQIQDFRSEGYVVLGVGGGLLITGAITLLVTRLQARRGKSYALAWGRF